MKSRRSLAPGLARGRSEVGLERGLGSRTTGRSCSVMWYDEDGSGNAESQKAKSIILIRYQVRVDEEG